MNNTPNPGFFWLMTAVCVVAAYLLPYHEYPFLAFYNEWLALLGVAMVLVLVFEHRTPAIHLPWIAIVPAVLAVVIGMQALSGLLTIAWDAIFPIAYLLAATIAIVLGATISVRPQGPKELCKALAWAHVVAGLVSMGLASLQLVGKEAMLHYWVMQMPHEGAIRPYANTGQPNQLALLFCLALASVWWLYQVDKLRAGVAIAMAVLLLWGLTLSQSRIGWIIIPLMMLFLGWWRSHSHFKKVPVALMAVLVIGYVCGVLALPALADAVGAKTESVAEHVGTGSLRWVLLQQAWEISSAHPWFGAGWSEFGPQQLQIGADFDASSYVHHAHNIVMNFAVELGWPVTIAVFAALAYWFYRCCLRSDPQQPLSKEVGFATLFFVAILVHSLVEFPLWYAYVLIPMAFLLGMVHQQRLGGMVVQVSRGYLLMLFLLMTSGLVGVAADYRRVVVSLRALGWERLGMKAEVGSTESPGFTLFPYFYDYFRVVKTPAVAGMSAEDIAFMERVSKRFGNTAVLMRMSVVYALNGRPDNAVRVMKTFMKLHKEQYSGAYQAWQRATNAEPEKFALVFKQLEPPPSQLDVVHGKIVIK